MGYPSAIEWTDATWNPIGGCSIKSPGCIHCYAQGLAGTRLSQHALYAGTTSLSATGPVFNGHLTVAPDDAAVWTWPLRWSGARQPKRGAGERSMIFVGDMSDLCHEDRPRPVIDHVFAVMALAWQHDFQVLTKRPDVLAAYCLDPETRHRVWARAYAITDGNPRYMQALARQQGGIPVAEPWPLRNLWAGTSAERQQEADERLPHLMRIPAPVLFVSCEPLLGAIDLWRPWGVHGPVDWVIAGGESGNKARSAPARWMRLLRNQCESWGVPFFAKQWGAWIDADHWHEKAGADVAGHDGEPWAPVRPLNFTDASVLAERTGGHQVEHHSDGSSSIQVGKAAAGAMLDGRLWREWPKLEESAL